MGLGQCTFMQMTKLPTCTAHLKNQAEQCGKPVVPGKAKCRGHGGLSTGPRTQEGLAKLAALKTVHGRETRALRILRSQLPAPPSAEKLDLMKRIDIVELQKAGLAYRPFI